MLASTSSPEAGSWLRAKRERLHLTVRKVQDLSLAMAKEKGDMDYYVSRSWLSDIENGKFRPSLQKLYSLSLIYQCDWNEVVTRFPIRFPVQLETKNTFCCPIPIRSMCAGGMSKLLKSRLIFATECNRSAPT